MSLQDNKAIVERVYLEMFNEGNLEVADKLLTRDHVIHIPPLPWDQVGLDTMKYLIACSAGSHPIFTSPSRTR